MHPTRRLAPLAALLLCLAAPAAAQRGAQPYVPAPGDAWERRAPRQVGMDSARLAEAVAFARAHESTAPRDLEAAHHRSFGREPFGAPVGPFAPRGEPTGIVVRHGYLVAEWGDPERVEMTFSVTKSFLSTVVGLAVDRGMVRSVDDAVGPYVGPLLALEPGTLRGDSLLRPFEGPHNARITWDHLLRQTSDWEGTLWGKPEWADRPDAEPATWGTRARHAPGSVHEYNDVRVNLLALAALAVWRRPLPQVLREHVMEPIGASPTWQWHGYDNSWVLVDGVAVQSVSGGGHWGGGMFISARDQARFGLLTLRRGRWGGRQVLSEEWIRMATTSTAARPGYGFMNFFLNRDRALLPSAPPTAFAHLGNGTNLVYVDPENDLVVVARWIQNDQLDGLVGRVLAAVER